MKKVTILKSIVNWLIKKLLYPFNNDLPYFLLLFTINLFVCFCMILIEGTLSFFISTTLFIYAMTYFLVFTANINKHMGYYVIKPLLLMIGITLFLLNTYCLYKYKSRLAIQIICMCLLCSEIIRNCYFLTYCLLAEKKKPEKVS